MDDTQGRRSVAVSNGRGSRLPAVGARRTAPRQRFAHRADRRYDLVSREERWRFTATGLGSSAFRIAAIDGVVYVPFANGRLVALRIGDGQELWRIGDWTSGFFWPPAVREDTFLLSGAGDGMSAVRDEP